MDMEQAKEDIIMMKSGAANSVANDCTIQSTDARNLSFTVNNKGGSKGSLTNGLLCPGQKPLLVFNNQAFDHTIIPGIKDIWLESQAGVFYDFTIKVVGGCPKGKWDNKLTFTDESGDTYTLRIYATAVKEHYVNYHSPAGNIVKITWDI